MTRPSASVDRRAILFDAYPSVYGGAQRTDHLLARRLPEHGWELVTFTPAPGTYPSRLRAEGLAVEVVSTPRALSRYGRVTTGGRRIAALAALPRYWLRLVRAFRRVGPAVVHVVDHRGLVLALVPARLSGARVVWHVQALDPTRSLNRWGARLSHCVVVPAASVVAKLPGLGAVDDLRVIPNVVPDAVRRPELGPLANGALIVTTARLHPDKGLDLLVDALALVRAEVPGARVRVLGAPQDGFDTLATELRAHAERAGVAEAFELAGFVDRPDEAIADARCYVQPSRERTEILPLAVVEAMAVGIPVVVTDVGGLRDLVEDDGTGLLVEPEDPIALARALVRLLVDDALAERLRAAAARLVDEPRFHEHGLLSAMVAAYEGRSEGIGG